MVQNAGWDPNGQSSDFGVTPKNGSAVMSNMGNIAVGVPTQARWSLLPYGMAQAIVSLHHIPSNVSEKKTDLSNRCDDCTFNT